MTTLAQRLKLAMAGPPVVSQRALAGACNVKPPSVNDWLSGKTKTIEGSNLLNAARHLRVRPDWLATGSGPMRSDNVVALESQPVGPSVENMSLAVEVTRYWIDLHDLKGAVEDHIPLLAIAHDLVLEVRRTGAPGTVLDLSKKLAARLREEKADDDERGSGAGPGGKGGGVRGRSARERDS